MSIEHVTRWGAGVLPLDCPKCGRHRLEYGLNDDGAVVHVKCEKCSWTSDQDRGDDHVRTQLGSRWVPGRWARLDLRAVARRTMTGLRSERGRSAAWYSADGVDPSEIEAVMEWLLGDDDITVHHVQQVWAVVYSNYDPAETDSLWSTEVEAQKRCAELNSQGSGMREVAPWTVRETCERGDPVR